MYTKNAFTNLKNRYRAVLKKCALINTFGTLALVALFTMGGNALAADNPAGITVKGMDATDGSSQNPAGQVPSYDTSTLNNYGTISGGGIYNWGYDNNYIGMFGNGTTAYAFTNSGAINLNLSANDLVYGMYAYATNAGHTLSNSGTIDLSGRNIVYGMYAYAQNGNHTVINTNTLDVSGTRNYVFGMAATAEHDGNHRLNNSGTINVSGDAFVYGMYVRGNNVAGGIHHLSNTGIITATASSRNAYEAYGADSFTVDTWATTLRTWSANDTVFGLDFGHKINFANGSNGAHLILHAGTEAQGFMLGQEYSINKMVAINDGGGTMDFATFGTDILGSIESVEAFESNVYTALLNTSNASNPTVSLTVKASPTPTTAFEIDQQKIQQIHAITGELRKVQTRFFALNNNKVDLAESEIELSHESHTNKEEGLAAGSPIINDVQNTWLVFVNPYGRYTNNHEYGYTSTAFGVTAGASYAFSPAFTLGLHFDYNASSSESDENDVENSLNSLALGLHGSYYINNNWFINGQVTAFLGENSLDYTPHYGHAQDEFSSYAIYTALSTGYTFEIAKNHYLIPEIGLSYLYSHTDDYELTFNAPYNIYSTYHDSTSSSALYADFMLSWQGEFAYTDVVFMPRLGLGVRQNLTGSDIDSAFSIGSSQSAKYSFTSSTEDTTILLNAGLDWQMKNVTIGAYYNGELGSDQNSHSAGVQFKYSF